jgi:Uncharacterised nucleotidyltransferase
MTAIRQPRPWSPVQAAATSLAVDAGAAEVVTAFKDAGVASILLKGASFDRWLYGPHEPRNYRDVDLLVSAADQSRAEHVLSKLGYLMEPQARAGRHIEHSKLWIRASDHMHVDLHRSLIGIDADAVDPWEALSGETEIAIVGGHEVRILREPGRAMHVALHAAAHGRDEEKTLMELDRALERVSDETWRVATALARRLQAEETFALGLRLRPAGAALAERLALTTHRTVKEALFARSASQSAFFFDELSRAPGLKRKLRLVVRRIAPDPEYLRAWHPLARRGLGGLALAYVWHQFILMWNLGPAAWAWWWARRDATRH